MLAVSSRILQAQCPDSADPWLAAAQTASARLPAREGRPPSLWLLCRTGLHQVGPVGGHPARPLPAGPLQRAGAAALTGGARPRSRCLPCLFLLDVQSAAPPGLFVFRAFGNPNQQCKEANPNQQCKEANPNKQCKEANPNKQCKETNPNKQCKET